LLPSPGHVDLLDVAGDDGHFFESSHAAVAGRGEAIRLDLSYNRSSIGVALARIAHTLSNLETHDGATPLAFVSIPFVDTLPILAVVPEFTVQVDPDGNRTTIAVHVDRPGVAPAFAPPLPLEVPRHFSVAAARSPKEWCDSVDEAISRLRSGRIDKVVLARQLVVEADAPLSQYAILDRLRTAYPSAFRYALNGFVGASPELLLERRGSDIRSQPMAGTVARGSGPESDQAVRSGLLRSEKDLSEHRFLVDMVRETLQPYCTDLVAPTSPDVVSLANVHHLATAISGRLTTPMNVLDLVAALHPTPAVGGRPTEEALAVIAELEELDRGRYAGAIGWVDANGDGCFAVAIRCAQLEGNRALLFAGNGIVAESDSQRELEETRAKFQAMLTAIIRP